MNTKVGHTPKFPSQRKELLKLLQEDQEELRSFPSLQRGFKSAKAKERSTENQAKRCHARSNRMLQILSEISQPTISHIGLDGSEAVSILALHSYLDILKTVLALFEQEYKRDKSDIYYQAIPSLKDRVMILEHKKQLFGTNWTVTNDGKVFLISVKDFAKMNKRRAEYGLQPARRPTDMSFGTKNKHPLGKGLALESDQKKLTAEEYEAYSKYLVRPLTHEPY